MRAGKDKPQGCCLDTLEKLMKECPGGPYLVMKSTPRVPGDRTLMSIGYTFNCRKFLGFIATEGSGSTEPGDTYLSNFSDIYYNVYVFLIVCPHLIDRYFNS